MQNYCDTLQGWDLLFLFKPGGTYIFARQEVHSPLNVLHTDAAADVRLG